MEALIEVLKSLLAEGRMHNHLYITRPQMEELIAILERLYSAKNSPEFKSYQDGEI